VFKTFWLNFQQQFTSGHKTPRGANRKIFTITKLVHLH